MRVAPYQEWPIFAWLSGQLVPTDSSIGSSARYSHWGTFLPGGHLEPNNIFPNETCGCANATQALPDGLYGWADAQCGLFMPFVCEMAAAVPPPPAPAPPAQRVKYVREGATYQLVTELLDWGAARAVCRESEPGADLVTWVGGLPGILGAMRCSCDGVVAASALRCTASMARQYYITAASCQAAGMAAGHPSLGPITSCTWCCSADES
jgi:hypothetical protein